MSSWRLISHQGPFFVQGFYAHRIHILAQSKKVAGVIIAVSFRKRIRSEHCKIFARYTALFHSTWRWDSNWGWYGAEEILQVARDRQTDDPRLEYHCSMDNHAILFPNISFRHHLQMWNIGSILCDIIIAICMTYYVGFLTSVPPVSEEKSNLIFCSRWQLWRCDSTITQTKMILKKVIRLTIGTGSLTGI